MEAILVYLAIGLGVAFFAIKEDKLSKKVAKGFKLEAMDGDKDGKIQDGTEWERPVKKKSSPKKKK